MGNALSTVAFVAVLALLIWLGWRYEPHWCAKDGRRFTARTRPLVTDADLRADANRTINDARGSMLGLFGGYRQSGSLARQWRDARVFVDDDTVQIITRVGALRRPLPPARVVAKGESTSRRVVYLVDGDPMRELRIPVDSRAVPVLDELVERTSGNRPA